MSGYGRSGGGPGRSRGDDCGCDTATLEMFVPARSCGKIIGRGGAQIRELQEQSHCKIKVSRDDEHDGTRRVDLNGADDAIDMARELIYRIIEDDSQRGGGVGGGGGGNTKDLMKIDSSFVGRVIGKGGSKIRELQDISGCRINVSRDGDRYGLTDVELIGSRSAVQNAKTLIDELTSQQAY